ncbi:MAG: hypothetical protein R3F37_17800 [Candidatus Competibacteraceae bacterium]
MKLRTRITLMVCGCFIIVALALMVEGRFREWNAENRYRDALVTGYRNAWMGITNVELQRMSVHVSPINRNNAAISALAMRDQILYADSLRNNILSLQGNLIPPQLETVTVTRRALFYHGAQRSGPGHTGRNPLIQQRLLAVAREALRPNALTPPLVEAAVKALTPIVGNPAAGRQLRFGRGFRGVGANGPSGVDALYIDLDRSHWSSPVAPAIRVFIVKPTVV